MQDIRLELAHQFFRAVTQHLLSPFIEQLDDAGLIGRQNGEFGSTIDYRPQVRLGFGQSHLRLLQRGDVGDEYIKPFDDTAANIRQVRRQRVARTPGCIYDGALELLALAAQGCLHIGQIQCKEFFADDFANVFAAHLFRVFSEPLYITLIAETIAQVRIPIADHSGHLVDDRLQFFARTVLQHFGRFVRRDVHVDPYHAQRPALFVPSHSRRGTDMPHRSAGIDHSEFGIEWHALVQGFVEQRLGGTEIVRMDTTAPNGISQRFRWVDIVDTVEKVIPNDLLSLQVQIPNTDLPCLRRQAQALAQLQDLLLLLAPFGDVLDLDDDSGPLQSVLKQRNLDLGPDSMTFLVDVSLIELVLLDFARLQSPQIIGRGLDVVGVGDIVRRSSDQLFSAISQNAAEGAVDFVDAAGKIAQSKTAGSEFHGVVKPRFAGSKQ
ncbi:conserved hypothetical protein [Ricinus communis]|uniref:Uncharacterized protein n=1 Tax=Ricinus communis TaxID=3988 RepID=B9TCR4_RICCO|nr:conserved hypothetical protein [Ricinus communis]